MVTTHGSMVTGLGIALPPRIVTNGDIETLLATSDQWIVERSGIRSRRAADGPFAPRVPSTHPIGGVGTTAALAIESGRNALENAGVSGSEIEMLVLCTTTPDQLLSATSSAVAAALGIGGGAMDVNAACAGFTYGLVTAAGLLATGAEKVLLIGAETMTRITNWEDRSSAFLFGDGAGAVVLEGVDGPGSLLGWDVGVDGSLVEILYADHGSTMNMKGREVFRKAIRVVVEWAATALKRADVAVEDVVLFVPHQANLRLGDSGTGKTGRRRPFRRIRSRYGVGFSSLALVVPQRSGKPCQKSFTTWFARQSTLEM